MTLLNEEEGNCFPKVTWLLFHSCCPVACVRCFLSVAEWTYTDYFMGHIFIEGKEKCGITEALEDF